MRGNRGRNTSLELSLRRVLHARGLRYRIHRRPLPGLRCEADVLFASSKVAVFIDGCWWHGCPDHWVTPKANRAWWITKVEINVARDRRNDAELRKAGWTVIRVWEHEDPE